MRVPSMESDCEGTVTHTPGPWRILAVHLEEAGTAEPRRVLSRGLSIVDAKGDVVCDLYEHAGSYLDRFDNDEANGRLITSAPDLLSIAKRWLAHGAGSWHPDRYAAERERLMLACLSG